MKNTNTTNAETSTAFKKAMQNVFSNLEKNANRVEVKRLNHFNKLMADERKARSNQSK